MSVPEIDVAALRRELDGPQPPVVIDVREADELVQSRLPDDIRHIPLNTLPTAISDLDKDAPTVVLCRVGGRSAQATAFLIGQGFKNVRNVKGGMIEYVRRVDPTLAQP